MWATQLEYPKGLQEKYDQLAKLAAVLERIEDRKRSEEDGKKDGKKDKKKKKEKEDKKKEKKEDEKEKKTGRSRTRLPIPPEIWARRKKAGLCMKCGSSKYFIKDCESEVSTVDP